MANNFVNAYQVIKDTLLDITSPIPMIEVKDDESLRDKYGFNSTLLKDYILRLENKLNITFNVSLSVEEFNTIQDVLNYVISNYRERLGIPSIEEVINSYMV